jgi:dipeptidyl-peptidase-4
VFKAGVAVAPVTGTIPSTPSATKLPKDNEDGYGIAPLNDVEGYKGACLLLARRRRRQRAHAERGVARAPAHQRGQDFDYMVYPQKEHGIAGGLIRPFLPRR